MSTENQAGRLTLVPLVTRGFEVFLQNFRSMLPLVLIYLPFLLVINYLSARSNQTNDVKSIESLVEIYFLLLIVLAMIFLSVIPSMAIIKMVESAELGTTMNWQDALRHAVARWSSSILTMLIMMLIVFGLTLLLVVPGIIWEVYYVFAINVVSLRSLSGKAALDYSKRLVKGQWWRVVGYGLAVGIGVVIVQIPVNLIASFLPLSPLAALINAAAGSLVYLFTTIVFTLFFLNLEAMKEDKGGAEVSPET
ncbi:MAG TPA: hypothetical protein VN371_09560 [Chlorobaculum sp.]|nr:hypothetical protein [Chlorobaculum sp.]